MCNFVCSKCEDEFICTACKAGFRLDNNTQTCLCATGYLIKGTTTCTASCSIGFYGNITTAACEKCDLACTVCYGGTLFDCTHCEVGKYLMNNTCGDSSICDFGYYADSTENKCKLC